MQELKQLVYKECLKIIESKRQVLEAEMKSALESGNDESKSSAGDKHETGRAMAQLAQENLSKQLNQLGMLQKAVDSINPDHISSTVELGSLVKTNSMTLFIGVPLGELNIDGKPVFAISMASPIGRLLRGKKVDESFVFNGKELKILDLV